MANLAQLNSSEPVEFITDIIFEEIERRIRMIDNVQNKIGTIFQFNISKKGQSPKQWILDAKSETPSVYQGECKKDKPECVIDISDENMSALAVGDLDPVKAFMSGYIRLKGNPMLTQKLDILFKLDSSDVYDSEEQSQSIKPTCKTDILFEKWLMLRLDTIKELVPTIKNVYQWNILKDGKVVSIWTCDFKNGDGSVYRGEPKIGNPNCTLTIEDEIAVSIFGGKEDPMKAFMSGKLKIGGNVLAAQKLQTLWAEESPPPIQTLLSDFKTDNKLMDDAIDEEFKPKNEDEEIDNIPCSGLRCDLIFTIFRNRCHEEPDFMRRLRVAFQFNITKKGKPICVWTADNKTKPIIQVYRSPPRNIKPDVIVTVEDDDLLKIMVGKVNPQRLFMMGKVKVKGNIMLLQKLNNLWLEYQKLGKNPELPVVVEVMMKDPIKENLKSEAMFIELMQRVVKLPNLPKKNPGLHQFNIEKNKEVVSQWTLDFKTGRNTFYRGPAKGETTTEIFIDDIDFARLCLMHVRANELVRDGKVRITKDNTQVFLNLDILFITPTSLKPKL